MTSTRRAPRILDLTTFLLILPQVFSLTKDSILWDQSNTLFSSDIPLKTVKLGDKLNFDCSSYSFNKVHFVERQNFHSCDTSAVKGVAFVCNNPNRPKRPAIKIAEVSPIPNAPLFKAGQDYYLISTSTGDSTDEGIRNTHGGLCESANLRLKIRVLEPGADADIPRVIDDTISDLPLFPEIVPQTSDKSDQTKEIFTGVLIGIVGVVILVLIAAIVYLKFSPQNSSNSKYDEEDDELNFNKSTYIDIQKPSTLYLSPSRRVDGAINPATATIAGHHGPSSAIPYYESSHRTQTIRNCLTNVRPMPTNNLNHTYLYKPVAVDNIDNLPPALHIVGEPSQNAFLSIARRVDPLYEQEVRKNKNRVNRLNKTVSGSSNGGAQVVHHEMSGYDTMESDESHKKSNLTDTNSGNADVGYYEGSAMLGSPISPRLDNGGLVISV